MAGDSVVYGRTIIAQQIAPADRHPASRRGLIQALGSGEKGLPRKSRFIKRSAMVNEGFKMTSIFRLFIIIFLSASSLTACSSYSGNIRAADPTIIDKIKIGKTTKEEVRNIMGEPSSIQRLNLKGSSLLDQEASLLGASSGSSGTGGDGISETWIYRYSETNIGAKMFIPFANLVGKSAVDIKSNSLMVQFNQKGIVENVISNIAGDK